MNRKHTLLDQGQPAATATAALRPTLACSHAVEDSSLSPRERAGVRSNKPSVGPNHTKSGILAPPTSALLALALFALLSTINYQLSASPLGTAFTYQGRLNDTNGPVTGYYDFFFSLYDSANNETGQIGSSIPYWYTPVTNGLFTVSLDFGNVFTGNATWLKIIVRTNYAAAWTTLSPRQPLTPGPHAVYASSAGAAGTATNVVAGAVVDASVAAGANISDTKLATISTAGKVANSATTASSANGANAIVARDASGNFSAGTVTAASFSGSGAGLTSVVPADNSVTSAKIQNGTILDADISASTAIVDTKLATIQTAGKVADTALSASVSKLGQTIEAGEVDASTFNTTFWKVNGNAGTTPGTQFLGTTDNQPLTFKVNGQQGLQLSYGVDGYFDPTVNVVGGLNNTNLSDGAFIGGGRDNSIGAECDISVIGGGKHNTMGWRSDRATIAGGYHNTIGTHGNDAVIGGGYWNEIADFADLATIAGGLGNKISGSEGAAIAGGLRNTIGEACNSSVIGGGDNNVIAGYYSYRATITGGDRNAIGTNSANSSIGGGYRNAIADNSKYATIAGGRENGIDTNSAHSAIGGGYDNNIAASSDSAIIAGGQKNDIGTNSGWSAIGGGTNNNIADNSKFATIAGGRDNDVGTNSDHSAIGGGCLNRIEANSPNTTIAGGEGHYIGTNSARGTIGGGLRNTLGDNSAESTIAGGEENVISSVDSAIGGGYRNVIETNAYSSAIAGGAGNKIVGWYAAIPGGRNNQATNYALAAGRQAKVNHEGSFVWADSQNADFVSTVNNEAAFRCNGGVRFTSGSGGGNQTVSWAPGSGSWSFSSDRNLKEGFAEVDPRQVLERLARLPLSEWNYKGHPQRHIGPMAQDFHALFPLSESETTLNSADLDGVALAAIQGLNEKVEVGRKKEEGRMQSAEESLRRLATENAELKKRLERLERLLNAKTGGEQ